MRAVLLATLCFLGCQATTVRYEGRPCSAAEPCGGGLRCDPVKGLCVAAASADGQADRAALDALADVPAGDRPGSDRPGLGDQRSERARDLSPDQGRRDQLADRGPDKLADRGRDQLADRGPDKLADRGPDKLCAPSCAGKQCGPNGCGGSCGSCATPPNTTCNASGQCVCSPSCGGKSCGPDGCGGVCGSCGSGSYCASGNCATCPTCASLGYYTGSLRGCTFDGSNGCWCPGSDGNGNNTCDSGESCWGSDNCSGGNHNPANCTTKKNISVPAGCTPPAYCFECI